MTTMTVAQELLERLPPGSHTAMRVGCKCDPFVNQWGYGTDNKFKGVTYAVNQECRLHAPRERTESSPQVARQWDY